MSENKIKVLHIMSSLNASGGVMAVVKNYWEEIDKNKFSFDIAYFLDVKDNLKDYFENANVGLYKFDKLSITNAKKIINQFKEIIIKSNCNIIHLHMSILHYFVKKAKKLVEKENPNRKIKLIQSAHTSKLSESLLRSIRNRFLIIGASKNTDKLLACSEIAGKKFFGKAFKNGEVWYNAINLEKYKKQENLDTEKLKKELNIKNEKIYCHIGRICKQKNQNFLIDVFNEIIKREPNSILLLIGGGFGEYLDNLKQKIENLKLTNNIKFLGSRPDVNNLLNISHALIFPSTSEGLGIVLIEAQVSNTLCFASDVCPKETNMSNLINYISLKKPASYWAEQILKTNYPQKVQVDVDNWDIKKQVKQLERIYIDVLK